MLSMRTSNDVFINSTTDRKKSQKYYGRPYQVVQTHNLPNANYLRQQNFSAMSPGTMAGSTFAYDDDVSFMELADDAYGSRDELFGTLDQWNADEDFGVTEFPFDDVPKKRDCVTPVTAEFANYNWREEYSNVTQVDFTPFLERLDCAPETQHLARQMMQLIARYFHDKITIFKDDKRIFNALDEENNLQRIADLSDSLNEEQNNKQRVMCNLELDENVSPRIVRDFLSDADDLLGNRDDLKSALRSALPPTMVASGFGDPIFSSPLARKKRRAAQNNTMSAAIAALYGNKDDYDYEDMRAGREKRLKKRGRPRKNTVGSESEIPISRMVSSNSLKHFVDNEGMVTRQSTGTIVPSTLLENAALLNAPKLAIEVEATHLAASPTASKLKQMRKKKELFGDDEWRPEKKRPKASRKDSASDGKKMNKMKSPTDKAKEEADLIGMGVENLEKHIITLQHQMRNVKHKHRKGTICPRCTTEQRLKLALKARNRAQIEVKAKPILEVVSEEAAVMQQDESLPVAEEVEHHEVMTADVPQPEEIAESEDIHDTEVPDEAVKAEESTNEM